jgi:hypothetical protein
MRIRRVAIAPLLAAAGLAAGAARAEAAGYDGHASRPALAPSDPTFAPADPRESAEPRDMTSPRAMRRATRLRSRDRLAPDLPAAQTPPDLTSGPILPGRGGFGRRFETLWQSPMAEDWLSPNLREPMKQSAVRSAPPAPVRVAPAEPVPSPSPENAAEESLSPESKIRLTQAVPDAPPTTSLPPAVEAIPTAAAGLDKPLQSIALIEPEDTIGLRPADLASARATNLPPRMLSGSLFAAAHPERYVYCFTHQPIYFEDANLERCGIAHGCCQPVCSAAKFLSQAALWPYSLVATPPGSTVITLGDCPTCHTFPCGADFHR